MTHYYWYFCRWLLLSNLFYRRINLPSISEILEWTSETKLKYLHSCHRSLNFCLFIFTFFAIPLQSALTAVEFEKHGVQFNNIELEIAYIIVIMVTIVLIYIVYILPIPLRFSRSFLCSFVCIGMMNIVLIIAMSIFLALSL